MSTLVGLNKVFEPDLNPKNSPVEPKKGKKGPQMVPPFAVGLKFGGATWYHSYVEFHADSRGCHPFLLKMGH